MSACTIDETSLARRVLDPHATFEWLADRLKGDGSHLFGWLALMMMRIARPELGSRRFAREVFNRVGRRFGSKDTIDRTTKDAACLCQHLGRDGMLSLLGTAVANDERLLRSMARLSSREHAQNVAQTAVHGEGVTAARRQAQSYAAVEHQLVVVRSPQENEPPSQNEPPDDVEDPHFASFDDFQERRWLNKIHVGDCLEVMRRMAEGSVDLIVTSPPYNMRVSSGSGIRNTSSKLRDGYDGHSDDMPRGDYVAWQRRCLAEMMRLIPETGAIFYNHKWRVQYGLLEDQREIVEGFPVRQIIVWHRAGGHNYSAGYFLPTYEVVYLIAKPRFRLTDDGPCVGDVWRVDQDLSNPHPAPFPVEIPRRCIEGTFARRVLDPFMGSGTTALAAEMLGRDWIGIEKARSYVAQATRRLADWRRVVRRAG